MDKLRYEFKSDIERIEREVKEITQGLNSTQGDVELLKEKTEKDLKETGAEMAALRSKIERLEQRLNTEIENNIKLEQYTRRENLRFNNIIETDEDIINKTLLISMTLLIRTWELISVVFVFMLCIEWDENSKEDVGRLLQDF